MPVQGSFVRDGNRCSGADTPASMALPVVEVGDQRRFPERMRPHSPRSLGNPLGFDLALRVRGAEAFKYAPLPHS